MSQGALFFGTFVKIQVFRYFKRYYVYITLHIIINVYAKYNPKKIGWAERNNSLPRKVQPPLQSRRWETRKLIL